MPREPSRPPSVHTLDARRDLKIETGWDADEESRHCIHPHINGLVPRASPAFIGHRSLEELSSTITVIDRRERASELLLRSATTCACPSPTPSPALFRCRPPFSMTRCRNVDGIYRLWASGCSSLDDSTFAPLRTPRRTHWACCCRCRRRHRTSAWGEWDSLLRLCMRCPGSSPPPNIRTEPLLR